MAEQDAANRRQRSDMDKRRRPGRNARPALDAHGRGPRPHPFYRRSEPSRRKTRPFNPATDMPALVEKAKAIGDVALLILDPVVAAVPMTRNSHKNAETRNGMQPVVDFAKASESPSLGLATSPKAPPEKTHWSDSTEASLRRRCRASSWARRKIPR